MRSCSLGFSPAPLGDLQRTSRRGEAAQQRAPELFRVRDRLPLPPQQPLRENFVRGAEENAHGETGVEAAAELAARDAVAQDVAEEAEILDELAAREAFDEPRASPELDLEHRREVAVRAYELEMEVHERREPLAGRRFRTRQSPTFFEDAVHRLVEHDAEEVFLVAEIEVDRALGHLRRGRDLGDAGLVEPPPAERPDGRLEDAPALLGVGAGGSALLSGGRESRLGKRVATR